MGNQLGVGLMHSYSDLNCYSLFRATWKGERVSCLDAVDVRLAGDKHRSYQSVVKLNKRWETPRSAGECGAEVGDLAGGWAGRAGLIVMDQGSMDLFSLIHADL